MPPTLARFPVLFFRPPGSIQPGLGLLCLLSLIALTACGATFSHNSTHAELMQPDSVFPANAVNGAKGTPANATQPLPPVANGTAEAPLPVMDATWAALYDRLLQDNVADPTVTAFFSRLPPYSAAPMGVKITELYRNAFERKPPATPAAPQENAKYRVYKKLLTQDTLNKCTFYLNDHAAAFANMEATYGVPKETVAALIFVETRLGTYLGTENAFWSLASMAAANEPERVKDGIANLPLTPAHDAWLQDKLKDKSNWAYKELKALITHCTVNNLDPLNMPGSVYGAIGICQFMPSNLLPYGADGDGDGTIDLFNPADAIHSVARYLKAHGWKTGITVEGQRNVIKRYNNLTAYANTILTIADSLASGTLKTAPPDAPTPKASKAGAPKKKAAAKKTKKQPADTKKAATPAAKAKAAPGAPKKAGAKKPAPAQQ